MIKVGDKYKLVIQTGRGTKTVVVTVKEFHGSDYVWVEFPHPSVRRYTARQFVQISRLLEKVG
jgi:hypothetical protein